MQRVDAATAVAALVYINQREVEVRYSEGAVTFVGYGGREVIFNDGYFIYMFRRFELDILKKRVALLEQMFVDMTLRNIKELCKLNSNSVQSV